MPNKVFLSPQANAPASSHNLDAAAQLVSEAVSSRLFQIFSVIGKQLRLSIHLLVLLPYTFPNNIADSWPFHSSVSATQIKENAKQRKKGSATKQLHVLKLLSLFRGTYRFFGVSIKFLYPTSTLA